jgi:predicted nucleic acid-binding protein
MILADTSVWVEFLRSNKSIFPVLRELLEGGEILAMECVFGELLQGVKTTREKEVILDYWKYIPNEDENGIWLEAGKYSCENRLVDKGIGLIDSAIVCFARKYNAQVWSLDKKLMSILKNDEVFAIG